MDEEVAQGKGPFGMSDQTGRKIMWLSVSPTAPTGYGDQTRVFVPRIRDAGHDIAVSCLHGLEYKQVDWDGIRLYPKDFTGMNKLVLKHHVEHHGAGEPVQVISLFDLWPFMQGIRADFDGLDFAAWVPIDCVPLTAGTRRALDTFGMRPIAMSRFGEEQLRNAGYDPLYVPHGIETDVMKPAADKADCKEALGWEKDAFHVGIVAHNAGTSPSRKGFLEMLEAFRAFQVVHDDAILYLHTDITGRMDPSGGLPLIDHALSIGIPSDAIRVVNQIQYLQATVSKHDLSVIYTGLDVLLHTSWGEGFGIPIVEAQACGTPVITSAWTSMPELTGAGWQVGGQPWRHPFSGGVWLHPNVEEIVVALEEAYNARGDATLQTSARTFALQYDADRVFENHWVPALEALSKPLEVPPLPFAPNRAQGRAAKNLKAAA